MGKTRPRCIHKPSLAAVVACCVMFAVQGVQAQQIGTCDRSLGEAYLDVNNVRARIVNTGGLFYRGQPHVYNVPRFSNTNAIFAAAIWVGGLIDGEIRTSASRYGNNELWAGPLDDQGNPPSDCSEYDRLYKVSVEDAEVYDATGVASADLAEWPTGLGAPTKDASGTIIDLSSQPFSQRKDRAIDLEAGERPILEGDQSIWWIMNDRGNTHKSTDSAPIGLEVHATAFAARTTINAINDATLYRYRLINRNESALEEAYFGMFVDPDLGDFDDDLVGSDTTLGIAFVYNADNDDGGGEGYGSPVPAAGFYVVRGPEAPEDGVDNDRDGAVDEAGERYRLTNFMYHSSGGGVTKDPQTASHYYGYLKSLWKDNKPMTIGGDGRNFSEVQGKYFFPGNPVTHDFWSELNIDGLGTPNRPYDRRFIWSVGPFDLEPGESTEIVFAVVWSLGADHLDSIDEMRIAANVVKAAYEDGFRNLPPGEPPVEQVRLVSPAHSVHNQPTDLTFRWVSVSDAKGYQIEIHTFEGEPAFYSTTETELKLSELSRKEFYVWRVRSENVFGFGPWSQSRALITGDIAFSEEKYAFSSFTVTANAAGPLIPPDLASFDFGGFPSTPCPDNPEELCGRPTANYQQSTNESLWGIHVGGNDGRTGFLRTWELFLDVISQHGQNYSSIRGHDFELRFTSAGGKAVRMPGGGAVMDVPFELWNTGMDSPDDPTDDFRMIPAVCESECSAGEEDFKFDIFGDHPVSGSANDPFSDWFTWFNPIDLSPGENGYEAYFGGGGSLGEEVLTNMVLVNWNGGQEPPYTASLPEEGTIFRIESGVFFAPILASPANQFISYDGLVSFYWNGHVEDRFRIQISQNPDFSVGVDAPVTEQQFTTALTEEGTYYWRVQNTAGVWSETWSFNVLSVATGVEHDISGPAGAFKLFEPFPNPFREQTSVRYSLQEGAFVEANLYDILGRRVLAVAHSHNGPGHHTLQIDGQSLTAGVYFLRLKAGIFEGTKKIVVVR